MSNYAKIAVIATSAMLFTSFSHLASASVVLNGTRVIYQAGKKEVTIAVTNQNKAPVLIQSWVDNGAENEAESKKVPFVLTPPINRVDAGKAQTLRISYLGNMTLPEDRESIFWLNVLEVPAKLKDSPENNSRLNIAFRSRIKLFYRPKGLPGSSTEAIENLKWAIKDQGVSVTNPSKYYVSLFDVTYKSGGKNYDTKGKMIAPGATEYIKFKDVTVSNLSQLKYSAINDYGGNAEYSAKQ